MPALSIAALANIMDLFMGSPFWRTGQVYFASQSLNWTRVGDINTLRQNSSIFSICARVSAQTLR